MGSIREYLSLADDQHMVKWIYENTGGKSFDEASAEWPTFAHLQDDYNHYLVEMAEMAEMASEIEWLEENDQNHNFELFISELDAIRIMVETSLDDPKTMAFCVYENTLAKMAYTHSVTLLESYLGDTLKSIVVSSEYHLSNAMQNITEVSQAKYSLHELSRAKSDLRALTLLKIAEILFHNIPKVMKTFEAVLGRKLQVNLSNVIKITSIRHDIAHRNGRKKDGTELHITVKDLYLAINAIKKFAEDFQNEIYIRQIVDGENRWIVK